MSTRLPKLAGRLTWGLRVAGSAIALAVIFHYISFEQVWDAGRRLSVSQWLLALALFLAGHGLAAYKWGLLIDSRAPFRQLFRAHLAGLGANIALPGVAGGDLVRAGLLMKSVPSRSRLAAGSLVDRLIDTGGLVLIMAAGGWALWTGTLTSAAVIWRLVVLALASGILLFVAAWLARRLVVGSASARSKLVRMALKVIAQCAELAAEPWRLVACLAISLCIQCLFVAINIALAGIVGVMVSSAGWFYAWAGAKILAILPISLGGLGVREATMAALLQPLGASPQGVVAVGLLWQTILYASGILGLVVQALVIPSAPAGAKLAMGGVGGKSNNAER